MHNVALLLFNVLILTTQTIQLLKTMKKIQRQIQ